MNSKTTRVCAYVRVPNEYEKICRELSHTGTNNLIVATNIGDDIVLISNTLPCITEDSDSQPIKQMYRVIKINEFMGTHHFELTDLEVIIGKELEVEFGVLNYWE